MAKGFYFKLAKNNIKRNGRMYTPYSIACAIMCAMFFIIFNMGTSGSVKAGNTITVLLYVGLFVMALFVVGYMVYLNSFLIKQRKKEFGLYCVLGLEKRHLARIIFYEGLILNSRSLFLGLLSGTVFSKLMYMLLSALTHMNTDSEFRLSVLAYIVTIVYFSAVFTLNLLKNIFTVSLSDPIGLIHGEKKGEKKLRGIVPLTVLGLINIGVAYIFSFGVKNAALAITLFWPAVICVIIGTFMLFTSGSQMVLAAMKKNKRFYYKPQNFINVSTLAYRMRQNALGLANICILSTMVIVTVSFCCSLYFGQEKILGNQHPDDIAMVISSSAITPQYYKDITQLVEEQADKYGVELEEVRVFRAERDVLLFGGGDFVFKDNNANIDTNDVSDLNNVKSVYFVPLEDFNLVSGKNEVLGENEMLVLTTEELSGANELNINGQIWNIKNVYSDTAFTLRKNSDKIRSDMYFIVNEADISAIHSAVNPAYYDDEMVDSDGLRLRIAINSTGEREAKLAFAGNIGDEIISLTRALTGAGDDGYSFSSIDTERYMGYAMYGGLLFLGIFFAVLFLINTVIVMYFKQISEGFEDRQRFEILQKVGMGDAEVKRTINSQILLIFFLPLGAAVMHMFAAANSIMRMLEAFAMTDRTMTMLMIALTTLAFSVVYAFVFKSTAKAYYKIVKR